MEEMEIPWENERLERGENDHDDGIALIGHDRQSHDRIEEVRFEVLTSDNVVKEMLNNMHDVAQIIQINPTTCRILLTHFKWNKDRLLETFYSGKDQDALFAEAHVVSPFTQSQSNQLMASSSNHQTRPVVTTTPQIQMCGICCRTLSFASLTSMSCGHRFCKDCWNTYLETKITSEGVAHHIYCPESGCSILVDDSFATDMIRDVHVLAKYKRLITDSFVQCNPRLTWCPTPNCECVIKSEYRSMHPVTCKCGLTFCFACQHEWHEPINCRLLGSWIKKCQDDSETANWITANTKECPKCNATIEKDGGCNHMTCRNTNCRFEFCWLCMGPWEPHGSAWYNCNRFDDKEAKEARGAQERSRAALQRYLHYCNRYMNHQNSLRLENKLYNNIKHKMEQMQQMNMSWIEVQFLKRAVDVLCQCRRTLMYTYAFAFYLIKNNQVMIFESNQADLEQATEQLSEYLERDMESENIVLLKQKVQDKFSYVEKRRKELIKHCAEGDEKTWWEFASPSSV